MIGAIPIVIAQLTNTWNRNMNEIPPATIALYRSRALVTISEASPDDQEIEQEQDRAAEEPSLLGQRGEREVGRVRGQVVEPRLRRAEHATAAQPAAPTAVTDSVTL